MDFRTPSFRRDPNKNGLETRTKPSGAFPDILPSGGRFFSAVSTYAITRAASRFHTTGHRDTEPELGRYAHIRNGVHVTIFLRSSRPPASRFSRRR